MRFKEQVVVVTGASTGIGEAAARAFVAEGARVVLVARSAEPLLQLADELGHDHCLVLADDVTDTAAMQRGLSDAAERFGAINVLVNNAGFNTRGPLHTKELEALGQIIDVNLTAPIQLCRIAYPYLRRSKGCVVNVASLAGRTPVDGAATYSASKFGLRAFSYALAEEWRADGIGVTVVSPGPVTTGFFMDELDDVPDLVFSQPLSTAEEVAKMIIDCAADRRPERVTGTVSRYISTVGYLYPGVKRFLKPLLSRKGKRVKGDLMKAAHERLIENRKSTQD